jgi:lipopolysaccharide O-acetyltransferase
MISFLRRYSFLGLLSLAIDVLLTKIFFSGIRLIRRPFYIRGRRFIVWGKRFTAGVGLRMDAFPEILKPCLHIGDDVQVNDHVHIAAINSVCIGNNVLIASRVFISDHDHGSYGDPGEHSDPEVPPIQRKLCSSPVYIGDNVWIGEGVGILPGVRIGQGAVIGCGAIVTRDVPEYSLAVGNPARVIKKYNLRIKKWERI